MRKIVPAFLLLAALLAPRPAVAAAARAGRPATASRPAYVRLGDWARANEFALRRPDRDTLLLSNRWGRVEFNTDPRQDLRKAQINGVGVWLAFPLMLQNGAVFISQTDLEATLAPALWPPANRAGIKIKTICLDPGHGGKDPGEQAGGRDEKKYNLLLAEEVRDQLTVAGFKVVMTRSTDVFVDLPARPDVARRRGADLFVSIHFNTFPSDTSVRGVETYCVTPAGASSFDAGSRSDRGPLPGNQNDERNLLLAYQVQKSILKSLPVEDRGVKRERYKVLANATVPAILVEGGFMSNPAEGRKIFDPAYRRQLARAIVEGILGYQRAVKG